MYYPKTVPTSSLVIVAFRGHRRPRRRRVLRQEAGERRGPQGDHDHRRAALRGADVTDSARSPRSGVPSSRAPRSRRLEPEPVFADLEWVPAIARGEVPGLLERALAAGAQPPLEYIGTGMTSMVFADRRGRAFTVGRSRSPTNVETLTTEAEYLRACARVPWVRDHVVRLFRFHPEPLLVLERELVPPAERPYSHDLYAVWQRIARRMEELGWGPPEFKEDSFVFKGGKAILVDASVSVRFGDLFRRYVVDVLAGRRVSSDRPPDLAWALRSEVEAGRVPLAKAIPLWRRLAALPQPAEDRRAILAEGAHLARRLTRQGA